MGGGVGGKDVLSGFVFRFSSGEPPVPFSLASGALARGKGGDLEDWRHDFTS